jgi:hypothetical protein
MIWIKKELNILLRSRSMIYNNNIDDIMKQIKHIMIDYDIKQIDIVEKLDRVKVQ